MNPIQVPNDGGKQVNILGIPMVIRIHGRDTGGVISAVESHDVPGGGPPPHIHSREEEGFYVLEGEISVTVGEEHFIVQAGMFANMPVGSLHSFKNESQTTARMLISVAPAGLEKMFFEVGVPLAVGATTAPPPTKEEIAKMLAVAARYGVEIRMPKSGPS